MKTEEQIRHYLKNIIAGERAPDDREDDCKHPMGGSHAAGVVKGLEFALDVSSKQKTRCEWEDRENELLHEKELLLRDCSILIRRLCQKKTITTQEKLKGEALDFLKRKGL